MHQWEMLIKVGSTTAKRLSSSCLNAKSSELVFLLDIQMKYEILGICRLGSEWRDFFSDQNRGFLPFYSIPKPGLDHVS